MLYWPVAHFEQINSPSPLPTLFLPGVHCVHLDESFSLLPYPWKHTHLKSDPPSKYLRSRFPPQEQFLISIDSIKFVEELDGHNRHGVALFVVDLYDPIAHEIQVALPDPL